MPTKLHMNIVRSIEIEPLTEEYLENLLRKDLEQQLPAGAYIRGITFARKLNPNRIEVEVDALFEDIQPVVATKATEPEPVNEVVEEEVEEEEEAAVDVAPCTLKVSDIFGN